MKKFNQYFNSLSPARQRQFLLAFAVLFALLLAATLNHNQLHFKQGYEPRYIGRTNDSLTLKK